MLSIDIVERNKHSVAPPISEVSLALFTALIEIKNMNYIFVSDVYNEETSDFIKEIYKEAIDIQWPDGKSDVQTGLEQPQTWENGSPEFEYTRN